MNRRRRRSSPWRVFFLAIMVAVGLYINFIVVPATPPLFIPTATPTRSPESYVAEAEKVAKDGKFNQAIKSYLLAIQSAPKDAQIYIDLARLQVFTGNYKEAVSNAENAILLNQNNSMAHAVRGWALSFEGEYLPAEASLKKALELDPNSAVAYAYYAEMLAGMTDAGKGSLGSLDKAIQASKQAQAINPNLLEVRRARGIVLEITGNYSEAVVEFEAAVSMNSNIADLHMALGRNYRFLEEYDKAVEEFNRANALNPTDSMPLTYISRTYAMVGEYAKAVQFAEQAIKNEPTSALLYGNLGTMYYRNRQYEEAIPQLRLAVRGGKTVDGLEVTGLTLDYGRVAEYYSVYGLSLAKTGQCGEALQISQAMMQGIKDDEVSVYNAQEIINVCQQISELGGTATPTGPALSSDFMNATDAEATNNETPEPSITPTKSGK